MPGDDGPPDEIPKSDFIENSPGVEIHRELDTLTVSLNIQRGNFRELKSLHQEFREYTREDWEEIDLNAVIKEEYFRLLHNYISSVYTVINHSQRIVSKYGDDDLYDNYSGKLRDQKLDKRGMFLTQLRHYTQKRKVPPISAGHIIHSDQTEFRLSIRKDLLLDWDGWTKDAKAYLESLDNRVEILDIIKAYQQESEDFYEWFFKYARLYFSDELEATLERVLLIETLKSSIQSGTSGSIKTKSGRTAIERRVSTVSGFPVEYSHPFDPENFLHCP